MMKILSILLFIVVFSLNIWADLAPLPPDRDNFPPKPIATTAPLPPPIVEEKKPEPQGTCFGAILFTIGIFLLGQRIIRNEIGTQNFANNLFGNLNLINKHSK